MVDPVDATKNSSQGVLCFLSEEGKGLHICKKKKKFKMANSKQRGKENFFKHFIGKKRENPQILSVDLD